MNLKECECGDAMYPIATAPSGAEHLYDWVCACGERSPGGSATVEELTAAREAYLRGGA